jgi:hypothetical protein
MWVLLSLLPLNNSKRSFSFREGMFFLREGVFFLREGVFFLREGVFFLREGKTVFIL